MPPSSDPDLQHRLQQLMREVGAPTAPPPTRAPGRSRPIAQRFPRVPLLVGLGMALALVIGIQLGSLPWRYRRELWQAQGAALGVVVGLAIGRLSARRPGGGE